MVKHTPPRSSKCGYICCTGKISVNIFEYFRLRGGGHTGWLLAGGWVCVLCVSIERWGGVFNVYALLYVNQCV